MSLSKGAEALKALLSEVYGSSIVVLEEYYLGEGLRLDFYLPDYGLGFEYHGRQHEGYVEHFHGSAEGFRDSVRRDARKAELCVAQNIALVVIWHHQEMTKDLIISLSKEALSSFSFTEPVSKSSPSMDQYRSKRLDLARAARRERYLCAKKLILGRRS